MSAVALYDVSSVCRPRHEEAADTPGPGPGFARTYHRVYDDGLHSEAHVKLDLSSLGLYHLTLMVASTSGERGVIPSVANLAFRVHRPARSVERLVGKLARAGLLVVRADGAIIPQSWSRDQPDAACHAPGPRADTTRGGLTNAERQKQFRDRNREARKVCGPAVQGTATERVTATVTDPVTRVTARNGQYNSNSHPPSGDEQEPQSLRAGEPGEVSAERLSPRPPRPAPFPPNASDADLDDGEPFAAPPVAPPARAPLPDYPDGIEPADVEDAVRRVLVIRRGEFESERYVRDWCRAGAKPAWVVEAVEKAAGRPGRVGNYWSYTRSILESYRARGKSDREAAAEAGDSAPSRPQRDANGEVPFRSRQVQYAEVPKGSMFDVVDPWAAAFNSGGPIV